MRGSKYLPTVASLLADKVIREDEIVGFSDENREHILRFASIRRPDGKSLGYIHDVVWQLVRWGKILEDRQIKADIAANGLETALKQSTRKVTPPAV